MSRELRVIGSGGHAKVAISTARAAGWNVVAVFDDDESRIGQNILGVPITGAVAELPAGADTIIAIGSNKVRQSLSSSIPASWVSLVHPSAVVDDSVTLGAGTVVFAGAVIQPDTRVGEHAIINTSASVDHDCGVGAFAHIAPGVHLCGGVGIGEGALIGVGACAIPLVQVGAWVTAGAGAAITRDIPAGKTVLGVPGRVR